MSGPSLAVDIGGTKFSMGVFDKGALVARMSKPTDREGAREWMLREIELQAREWSAAFGYTSCGVGFGGPVRYASQTVALSTHVGGWSEFPLSSYLRERLGVPVVMDNDANVGALGERFHGAGSADPLFYMTLSTGIGGGIVTGDGGVLRGADSWAGELGHIVIRPGGPECLCGARGCLERMCSGLWLERDHGRTARDLMTDERFVRDYVVELAAGLKTVIMIVNPGAIVIGGGIAKAGEALFAPLREEVRRQMTAWSGARVEIRQAALGDDSVLWGAMELARRTLNL